MSAHTTALSSRRAATPPSRRRRWPAVALLAISVLAAAATWATAGQVEEVETIRPAAGVTAVDIDLAAGTVHLDVGEQLLVEVERRSGRFSGNPSVTSAVIDGVLEVTGNCPRLGIGRCATDVRVTLPPAAAVEVATDAGRIEGIVAGGPVRVSTAAGSVALTVTEDVDALSVSTGAGSIDLIVPGLTYAVTAQTGVGRTRIEVETAADAPRTIDARSGAGSITVRTAPEGHDQRATPMQRAEPAASVAHRADVAGPAPSNLGPPDALASFLDEVMDDPLEEFGPVGASVTVVDDGEVVVAKGYGQADLGFHA